MLDHETMDSDKRFGKLKEYKKGDIVVWRGAHPCIGKIKRRSYLVSLDSNKTKKLSKDCYFITDSHDSLHHSNLRKATEEEIEALGKNDILLIEQK